MRAQLVALTKPGFVTATGVTRLRDLPRYLRGISIRLSRLAGNAARDAAWMREVHEVRDEYDGLLASLPPHRRTAPEVVEVRWMIEDASLGR